MPTFVLVTYFTPPYHKRRKKKGLVSIPFLHTLFTLPPSLSPSFPLLAMDYFKNYVMRGEKIYLRILLWLMVVGFGSSDLNQDRTECADQLVGLATCLPYVGGDAKSPTIDCCSGLKQVLDKSKKCLCILVKDRNDPNLGFKINATLALSLPSACHAPAAAVSECPALLHLAPHSPDAKVFDDFANSTRGGNSTHTLTGKGSSNTPGSSAQLKSDGGGKGKRWLAAEVICGALLWCFTFNL